MVQLDNLQSLVARRSAKPFYAVLLLRLNDVEGARRFLKSLAPRIASGRTQELADTPLINVLVSWRCIAALAAGRPGLDPEIGRRQFESFFTDPLQGPDSRALADQLGFCGPSAPAHWWAGFRSADIDLAIYLGSDTAEQRKTLLAELRASATAAGLAELTTPSFPDSAPSGYLPAGGRLHFGYRDGVTSPDVDWSDEGRPRAVNFREFVVGYPTADYPTSPFRDGPWRDFARDGFFGCLTWIYQDVAGFEAFLAQNAPKAAPPPGVDAREWLAAQLMGRWRDGTPLAVHPQSPPAAPDLNDSFGYADDSLGARCPLSAHIRVAFSRDQPLSFANASRFPKGPPRLIRRGFSYGPALTAAQDDGADRGLFGIFLCARINEQFYSVLRWMQQTSFSDVFDDAKPGRAGQDRLVGSRLPGGGNSAPDNAIAFASGAVSLQPFIRYRGVAALFAPSLSALRELAP